MNKLLALLLVAAFANGDDDFPGNPMRLGRTKIKIVNSAAADIVDTLVHRIDDVEWGPLNAPQYNLQHLEISSGSFVLQPEDVNLNAISSNFNMKLIFIDGSLDEFKIDQQYVFDKSPGFDHVNGIRLIKYTKTENHTLVITIKDSV